MALTPMTRTQILALVNRALGQPPGTLDDVANPFVDYVYGFSIPDRLAGLGTRGEVELVITSAGYSYDLKSLKPEVRAVYRPVTIGGDVLDYYDDAKLFWDVYDRALTTPGEPSGVLVEGRVLTFGPKPDADYTVIIPCSKYREAVPVAGIANLTEAFAVINGAARELARFRGQESVADRMDVLFQNKLAELASAVYASEPAGGEPGQDL
jgi:hypothetical protein